MKQAILASLVSVGSWVSDANGVMQLAMTALGLAWWLRLWLKSPTIKPPWFDTPPK